MKSYFLYLTVMIFLGLYTRIKSLYSIAIIFCILFAGNVIAQNSETAFALAFDASCIWVGKNNIFIVLQTGHEIQ